MSRRVVLRWGAAVLGLATIQAAAVGVYLLVQRSRESPPSFAFDRADRTSAPELELEDARGRPTTLRAVRGDAVLLHFWASWCAPCRTELPALLALDGASFGGRRVRVVAVSTDDAWAPVHAFFGRAIPSAVLRGGPAASRRYGVAALPETYLLDRMGALRARFRGPRQWSSDVASDTLVRLIAEP